MGGAGKSHSPKAAKAGKATRKDDLANIHCSRILESNVRRAAVGRTQSCMMDWIWAFSEPPPKQPTPQTVFHADQSASTRTRDKFDRLLSSSVAEGWIVRVVFCEHRLQHLGRAISATAPELCFVTSLEASYHLCSAAVGFASVTLSAYPSLVKTELSALASSMSWWALLSAQLDCCAQRGRTVRVPSPGCCVCRLAWVGGRGWV